MGLRSDFQDRTHSANSHLLRHLPGLRGPEKAWSPFDLSFHFGMTKRVMPEDLRLHTSSKKVSISSL